MVCFCELFGFLIVELRDVESRKLEIESDFPKSFSSLVNTSLLC